MEMELIIVKFRDAHGKEWQAAGELAPIMVPVDGSEERAVLRDLEGLGPVRVVDVKVVRP